MKFCMEYSWVAVLIGHGSGHRKSNRELHDHNNMGVKGPLIEAANLDGAMNVVVCAVSGIREGETGLQIVPKLRRMTQKLKRLPEVCRFMLGLKLKLKVTEV